MRYLKKIIRYFIIISLTMFVLTAILIQLPPVQNYITQKIISGFKKQYNADIKINRVGLSLTGNIFITGFQLSDSTHTEIASFDKVSVRLSPISLFRKIILIRNLELSGARFTLAFDTAQRSNIDFLFSGKDTTDTIAVKTNAKPWTFKLNSLDLLNCKFLLQNKADSMQLSASEKKLTIRFSNADILHLKFEIKTVTLKSVQAKLLSYKRIANNDTIVPSGPASDLNIFLKRADFQDLRFEHYDSISQVKGRYYLGKGSIKNGTINLAQEQIGVENIVTKQASVYLNTGIFVLDSTVVNSTYLPDTSKSWSISAKNAQMELDEVLLILPPNEQLKYLKNIHLKQIAVDVSGNYQVPNVWEGTLNNLSFTDVRTGKLFRASGTSTMKNNRMQINDVILSFSDSQIEGDFTIDMQHNSIENIPQIEGNIKPSRLLYTDISPYFPSFMDSMNFIWPGACRLTGILSSKKDSIHSKMDLQSAVGGLHINGSIFGDSALTNAGYTIKIKLDRINVLQITRDSTLGFVSGNIEASGKGLKPSNMQAKVMATFDSLEWNHHIYRNINSEYSLTNGKFTGNSSVSDSILQFKLNANGTIVDNLPDIYFDAQITKANLRDMHFTTDTLSLISNIHGRLKLMSGNSVTAYLDTLLLSVITPRKTIHTSSKIIYRQSADSTGIYFQSNLGEMFLYGNIPLQEIIGITRKTMNPFDSVPKPLTINKGRSFRFSANIKDFSLLQDIYPMDVRIPEPGFLKGEYSEVDDNMKLMGEFARIELSAVSFDSASLNINSQAGKVQADININRIESKFRNIYDIKATGDIANKTGKMRISLKDREKRPWFDFTVSSHFFSDSAQFTFVDSARLNYTVWGINPMNSITITKNKQFSVKSLSAKIQEKVFSITGDNKLLNISFSNLDIQGLAGLYLNDSTPTSGRMKGEASISNLFTTNKLKLKTSLNISDIKFENYAMGNFSFAANNHQNPDLFEINAKLTKTNDQLFINGTYNLANDHPLDFEFRLHDFNLTLLSPFFAGFIEKPTGGLNATLSIKGNTESPKINGTIEFVKSDFKILASDISYSISGQSINFNGTQALFNGFKILDQNGKTMSIDGSIKWTSLSKYDYNLLLHNDRFLVYQSKMDIQFRRQNKIIISGDTKVTGKNTDISIWPDIRIDEGSSFFYKPTRNLATGYDNDLVTFIGKDSKKTDAPTEDQINYRFNLIANLELAPNTPVFIVIDPAKGDRLNAKAGGRFTLYIRPYQSPVLTGSAEINEGEYYLSITNFIRKFDISPNSSILWKGDLANPEANITASYSVRTSPQPLFITKTDGLNTEATSLGTLPFLLNLSIKDNISAPSLNFSISLPEEYENVSNGTIAAELQRINNDESEVNKQAASLLLLGTFFSSELFSGSNYQYSSRQSTNTLISQALNQFASQKVKFVNLNFNLASFNNYGETTDQAVHTELQVNASKSLLDSRLNTKLGVQLVLQGDEKEQSDDPIKSLSPEFNLEYLLNRNRTISIEVFRNSEYTGLIDSKVDNTGIGVSVKKDFDSFRDFFLPPKKEEKLKKPDEK